VIEQEGSRLFAPLRRSLTAQHVALECQLEREFSRHVPERLLRGAAGIVHRLQRRIAVSLREHGAVKSQTGLEHLGSQIFRFGQS
jgi:hypothetical protein